MPGGRVWSDKEEKQLIRLYSNYSNKRLAKIFNRTVSSIQKKGTKLGLRKSKSYLKESKSNLFKGSGGSNWKGGKNITSKGYRMIKSPDHPNATKRGYVMEHRLVIEENIGRFLKENEVVHHKNGNKLDNRIENLELMTHKEHTIMHHTGTKRNKNTKRKISKAAKERYVDQKNHPSYKDINPKELLILREKGLTVKKICNLKNICKRTFYNKINKYEESVNGA